MLKVSARALCGLALLVAGLPLVAQAQEKRCEMKRIAELPVTLDASNRPMIDGSVNGQPVKILASTGGDATFMTEALAKSLGLRVTPDDTLVLYKDARTSQLAGMSTVDSFGIGGAVSRNQRFSIWPGAQPYIVLGRAFWAQSDVEFDLAHKAIRLFRPVNCAGQTLAYWGPDYGVAPMSGGFAPGDAFVVEIMLNDKAVGAQISSNTPTSLVTTRVSRDVGLPVDGPGVTAQERITLSNGAKADVWLGAFKTFAIGDETIRNAKLRITDGVLPPGVTRTPTGSRVGREIFNEPQMILGADFLRSHRVLLSNSQKQVYFSYAGGPVFQVTGPVAAAEDEGGAR